MDGRPIQIKLYDFNKVRDFVRVTRSFMSDVDVMSGNTVLDGKSILSLYALDLSKPLQVRIISDDIAENRRFDAEMENFR